MIRNRNAINVSLKDFRKNPVKEVPADRLQTTPDSLTAPCNKTENEPGVLVRFYVFCMVLSKKILHTIEIIPFMGECKIKCVS